MRVRALVAALVCTLGAGALTAQEAPLGTPAEDFGLSGSGEIPLSIDTVVREGPSFESASVLQIRTTPTARVLEEQNGWVRIEVALAGEEDGTGEILHGWISLEDPTVGAVPIFSDGQNIDQRSIDAAMQILDGELEPWGAFDLLSGLDEDDAEDDAAEWLEPLRHLANAHAKAYRQRHAMTPVERTVRPVIVVFGSEDMYASFVGSVDVALAGVSVGGHSAGGVASVVVGERSYEDVAALLLHELTHLQNEITFPRKLPIWLEEGLAEDLAQSRVSASGELDASRMRGQRKVERSKSRDDSGRELFIRSFHADGPLVSLGRLVRESKRKRRIELQSLFELEWEDFILAEDRMRFYWKAGFLVRFLVSEYQETFERFLRAVARGESSTRDTLLAHLGMTLEELEGELYVWASFRAVRPR